MYLEKLEIQGFKSFANRNFLVFPGMLDKNRRGITAVVGPNGSGKSNVADAVRWALGEQSMKTLRGKKSEDVIFAGSDKKGKLGMAEVSLFLNNEDQKASIDYSQIVITRRLYRNGDSEYILNSNRVRLTDIQMLLAKAKFGQKTYSVIGQGMVEGFLNTTLAERKEFFDEATGVKQYQIRRDESLNKLRSSYENLIQAQMLLAEIEPRLKSLTRQVNRLRKRGNIEGQLNELQFKYYSSLWHEINDKFSGYNEQYLELEKKKNIKDKKLAGLNQELGQLETMGGQENEFVRWQNDLSRAQNEKDEINKKLARIEAQMELKLEANGQFDLSFLLARKEEVNRETKKTKEEIEALEKNIGYDKEISGELNKEKEEIGKKIDGLDSDLLKIGYEKEKGEIRKISSYLYSVLHKLRQVNTEKDINKIKELIIRAKDKVKRVLAISDKLAEREKAEAKEEEQRKRIPRSFRELNKAKENIITRINENNLRITARSERVRLLGEKIIRLEKELCNIGDKLKQKSDRFNIDEVTSEQDELKEQLSIAEDKVKEIREKINQATTREEKKRSKLFSLQKDLQNLQNEVNNLNNQLSELKVNSTRYETKLEDLEIEIRQELGSLKKVRENRIKEELNNQEAKEEIGQLKHQLELIGGIDPQIEKEYEETKERNDFLSGQVNDLTDAVDSLGKIIEELDLVIKKKFDKEYKIIAGKFERYFKILFNGGNAKIIKVMEEEKVEEVDLSKEEDSEITGKNKRNELADIKKIKFLQKHNATGLAGIEIQAVPPGKKIKSLAMLSGGERALTAIALICAIISVNPSPFVVLDEVDAALDEANSERLAKILDELSYKTQFILITHNRATMRRANILYGITMGDDGASKLLSIKLDEAAKTVSSK